MLSSSALDRARKVFAASDLGDTAQGRLVEIRRLKPNRPGTPLLRVGAGADGVDLHLLLGDQLRGDLRGYLSAGVGAVGDQHHARLSAGRWRRRLTARPMASPIAVFLPAMPICASSSQTRTVCQSKVSGACGQAWLPNRIRPTRSRRSSIEVAEEFLDQFRRLISSSCQRMSR